METTLETPQSTREQQLDLIEEHIQGFDGELVLHALDERLDALTAYFGPLTTAKLRALLEDRFEGSYDSLADWAYEEIEIESLMAIDQTGPLAAMIECAINWDYLGAQLALHRDCVKLSSGKVLIFSY